MKLTKNWLFAAILSCGSVHVLATELVDMGSRLTQAKFDIRYASNNNFVGSKITGYLAPKCLLTPPAAKALVKVEQSLAKQNMRLKIFDCYRPEKAVAHFMQWAEDLSDTKTKAEYYPQLQKSKLVPDYIASRSGHSRAYTIDLTLEQQNQSGQYQELDMGSPFDLFDTLSNVHDKRISKTQRQNRLLLQSVMKQHGYQPYLLEWWHFTHQSDPRDTYLNQDVK